MHDLTKSIRDVPDFPAPGIIFRDITPLLADPYLFSQAVDWYCKEVERLHPVRKIIAIESRGFIFGSAVAHKMNLGLVPVRKKGKLPFTTASVEYQLEYGTDVLEIHTDALEAGEEVVVLDDLLATGGTAGATLELVKERKAIPRGGVFLIELPGLKGRDKIKLPEAKKIISLIKYR